MRRIDSQQFNEDNKMIFQEDRWFIFLDHGDGALNTYYPRLAHKCKYKDREKHRNLWDTKKYYTCCLVILENEVCRDCHTSVPKTFSGFFNLTKWGYEQ